MGERDGQNVFPMSLVNLFRQTPPLLSCSVPVISHRRPGDVTINSPIWVEVSVIPASVTCPPDCPWGTRLLGDPMPHDETP